MSVPSTFLGQVFIRKFFAFAGNSLLLYDYLLTLSLEVTHIWNEPWTVVKLLFLINRYGNLIGQTFIMLEETGYLSHGSQNFCLAFQMFCSLFAIFSGESIRLFVVMRACAIMRFRRKVAMLMNALYVLYIVGLVVLSICLVLQYADASNFQYLDEVGICATPLVAYGLPANLWIIWVIPLFLDSTMLAFVWYSLYRSSRGTSLSRLVWLLMRDALLFYFATLFNVLFSMICWALFGQDPRNLIQTLITYPILSVVGQRLVLNLRRYRSRLETTRYLSQEVNRQLAEMAIPGPELDKPDTERVLE